MVSLAVLGTWNLEILQKQNAAIWLANTQICYLKTDFGVFLDKESDSEVRFGVTGILKKFDGPCNISMTYGSHVHKFENMRQ